MAKPVLYPMFFEQFLSARPWGGKRLARMGKELPLDQPIGETWDIYWKNQVANGIYQGSTLGNLIAQYPLEMVGKADASPEFPLLVKLLDANDWLSVQVHPDDAYAKQLEGEPRGKTECWYIIEAEPDTKLAFGLNQPLDTQGLRYAIETGTVEQVMQYVPIQAGDFIFVPAGTLHAIGPGALLYELQQTSDRTYRLYDWGHVGPDGKPRQLHLDKGLACLHYEVNPPAKIAYQTHQVADGVTLAKLIRGEYFGLDKLTLAAPYQFDTRGNANLVTAIRGHLEWRASGQLPQLLPQGTSAFVPAGIGPYQLIPDGEAEVLLAWPRDGQ